MAICKYARTPKLKNHVKKNYIFKKLVTLDFNYQRKATRYINGKKSQELKGGVRQSDLNKSSAYMNITNLHLHLVP